MIGVTILVLLCSEISSFHVESASRTRSSTKMMAAKKKVIITVSLMNKLNLSKICLL